MIFIPIEDYKSRPIIIKPKNPTYTRYINETTRIYFKQNEEGKVIDFGVEVDGVEQEIDLIYRVISPEDIEFLKRPVEIEGMNISNVPTIDFTFIPSKYGNALDYRISSLPKRTRMKYLEVFKDTYGNLGKYGLHSALEAFRAIQKNELALFEMIDDYLREKADNEVG